jgi:hypothetical protein
MASGPHISKTARYGAPHGIYIFISFGSNQMWATRPARCIGIYSLVDQFGERSVCPRVSRIGSLVAEFHHQLDEVLVSNILLE